MFASIVELKMYYNRNFTQVILFRPTCMHNLLKYILGNRLVLFALYFIIIIVIII